LKRLFSQLQASSFLLLHWRQNNLSTSTNNTYNENVFQSFNPRFHFELCKDFALKTINTACFFQQAFRSFKSEVPITGQFFVLRSWNSPTRLN
jgi:hypothetical protein